MPLDLTRYHEAVRREREIRSAAFVDTPRTVCEVPLRQMTLEDYNALMLLESPFLTGGRITVEDTLAFLWALSAKRRRGLIGWLHRRVILISIRALGLERCASEIDDYLNEAFFDAGQPTPVGPALIRPPKTCAVASIVDRLCSEYGWSLRDVMQTPMAILFQAMRASAIRRNPDGIHFNPLSDPAKREAILSQHEH